MAKFVQQHKLLYSVYAFVSCNASPDFDNNGFDVEIEYEILGRDDGRIVADVFLERTR